MGAEQKPERWLESFLESEWVKKALKEMKREGRKERERREVAEKLPLLNRG
jgi:hypothetical protein